MKTIINSVEIVDANGVNWDTCISNYLNKVPPNFSLHDPPPVVNVPKFDVPLTDADLQDLLEQAGYDEHSMPRSIKLAMLAVIGATKNLTLPKNTVVIGTTLQGSQETQINVTKAFFENKRTIRPRWGATVTASAACTTVSRHLGITGVSFMINQACSGFITALDLAEKFLDSGQTDCAIVFGTDTGSHPLTSYIFNSIGVHTQNEVKPLDKNRSGMALGEGAVCYVLTKQDKMQNYIAEISKIVLYNDNYNLTAPAPDGSAGKHILSQLTNEHIDSINCHATATVTGDDAEILSLESLPYSTYLYGMKGAIGHTMASSAGIEMAYSIAGLVNGWIPYTRSSTTAVESKHHIVLNDIVKKDICNFAKLSFGFGGGSAGILITRKSDV